MPAKKTKPSSSERRNWDNIFNLLVQMVRKQQNQLQSLATQHNFLEDRFKMQHEAWASDIRAHNGQISQMKGILMFEEKKWLLEAAKSDMVLGYKHKEAFVLKWVMEQTEDELTDFKACFECLSSKSSNGEDQETVSKDSDKRKKEVFKDSDKRKKGITDSENKSTLSDADEEKCSKKIKNELRRLRGECKKLSLEKSSEVLAVLAEKKFVWNQYNIMENDYTNKLRTKQAEVEKATEKIKILVSSMEPLQSENNKKDSTIAQLESKVADMEAEKKRLKEDISGLSVELDSLRKSRNNRVTPVLNRCTERTKTSDSGVSKSSKSSISRRNISLKKEISTPNNALVHANLSEKGNKGLKRKEGPAVPISETPKLFSSNFKVPKLKSSLRTETEYVSQMLTLIKRFAQYHGCHVWFVAHPRQLHNWVGGPPNLYDISGSAHFINKCDNGIVIHRNRDPDTGPIDQVQVCVRKVRNKVAGTIGEAVLLYNRVTGEFMPTDNNMKADNKKAGYRR